MGRYMYDARKRFCGQKNRTIHYEHLGFQQIRMAFKLMLTIVMKVNVTINPAPTY